MGKWATRRKTSKNKPQLIYESIAAALVVGMLIYSIVTGTLPENLGF